MNPLKVRRLSDITPAEESARRFVRAHLDREEFHELVCKECPKSMWFTAFFDGTGNNYVKDGNAKSDPNDPGVKYSNIAKLGKFAHWSEKDAPLRVYGSYIAGVGTPCHEGLVQDSGAAVDKSGGMAAAYKGQDRISEMLARLEKAVNEHWPMVSQINLAVFGFSRGATQARAFLRQLKDRLAEQVGDQLFWNKANVNQKKPEVVVYFVGIMDTVSSTGFGGSTGETVAKYAVPVVAQVAAGPIGGLVGAVAGGVMHAVDDGGHAEWARDLTIPPYVRQCVHYVAGHEVREKFPSDSVRRDRQLASNCVEYVYPGVHSDVGGGYAPANPADQEGRGNELARIPLCHMYIAAYTAGVPFKEPSEVLAAAGGLFEISQELERAYDAYMDGAPANGSLETSIIWHMNRYYEWRESRRRRIADGRLKPAQTDPYMAITDAEWSKDVKSIAESQTGYFTSHVGVKEAAIFAAYKRRLIGAMKPETRKDFDLFLDRYVHDSVAGFKKQMRDASYALFLTEGSRWSVNRKIFVGKRGDKFLYWRYESAGNDVAGIKEENMNLQDESLAAKRERQRAAEEAELLDKQHREAEEWRAAQPVWRK